MNKVTKNIIYLLSSSLLAKAIGIIRVFVIAKLLEPTEYGFWSFLFLLFSYIGIFTFGTFEAMIKKIPYFKKKEDMQSVIQIEETVYSFTIYIISILCFVGFTISLISNVIELPIEALLIAITVTTLFNQFFYFRFSSHQNFKLVGYIDSMQAVLLFIFQSSLTYKFGLLGTLSGFFLCQLLLLLFSYINCFRLYGSLHFTVRISKIVEYIKLGLPITLVWWIFALQSTIDRIITISAFGNHYMGIYSIGASITAAFILFPKSISKVLYPKMNEQLAEAKSHEDLAKFTTNSVNSISLFIPIIILIFSFFLPFIFYDLLPKYKTGMISAQILLIGAYFSIYIRNGANFLITIDKTKYLITMVLISIVFNILGDLLSIYLDLSIVGISLSTSLSSMILSLLIWIKIFNLSRHRKFHKVLRVLDTLFPYLLTWIFFVITFLIFKQYWIENILYRLLIIFIMIFLYSIYLTIKKSETNLFKRFFIGKSNS